MDKSKIRSIIEQYDPDRNEIAEVSRTGAMVAAELRKYKWLTWTKFPEAFENCRNESQFYQTIDNFNGWLVETGTLTHADEEDGEHND